MKATIAFKIETDYLKTGYDELIKLGCCRWVKGAGVCVWLFPIESIEKVSAILGTPIEFDGPGLEIIEARMPLKRQKVEVPEFKGKGHMEVEEEIGAGIYVITEYRKVEKEDGRIEIEELKHEVPYENVAAMREVLSEIDENRYKDGKIPGKYLAERVCRKLGINRFTRESGSFDWAKCMGNRKEYFFLYYYVLKVLDHLGEIHHTKNGKVIKKQRYLWTKERTKEHIPSTPCDNISKS